LGSAVATRAQVQHYGDLSEREGTVEQRALDLHVPRLGHAKGWLVDRKAAPARARLASLLFALLPI
jgi:hypothetical protein